MLQPSIHPFIWGVYLMPFHISFTWIIDGLLSAHYAFCWSSICIYLHLNCHILSVVTNVCFKYDIPWNLVHFCLLVIKNTIWQGYRTLMSRAHSGNIRSNQKVTWTFLYVTPWLPGWLWYSYQFLLTKFSCVEINFGTTPDVWTFFKTPQGKHTIGYDHLRTVVTLFMDHLTR